MTNIEVLFMLMYLVFCAAGFVAFVENRNWKKRLKNFGAFCLAAVPFFGMMFYFILN